MNLLPMMVGVSIDRDMKNWETGHWAQIMGMLGGTFGHVLQMWCSAGALLSALGQTLVSQLTTTELFCGIASRELLGVPSMTRLGRWKTPYIAFLFNATLVALVTLLPFEVSNHFVIGCVDCRV